MYGSNYSPSKMFCILGSSKAPFSVDIGETLTLDDLKKAAKMLKLVPFDADTLNVIYIDVDRSNK